MEMAMARFLGLWNCAQSRSSRNRVTTRRRSSRLSLCIFFVVLPAYCQCIWQGTESLPAVHVAQAANGDAHMRCRPAVAAGAVERENGSRMQEGPLRG